MTLRAYLCPKLRTPKNLVRSMPKKLRFRGSFRKQHLVRSMPKKSFFRASFQKQHGKRDQTLLKFQWQHPYYIYLSLCRQLISKMSLLLIYKMSRLFPTTLSANGKYSLLIRLQRIQMQFSLKNKHFFDFFLHY